MAFDNVRIFTLGLTWQWTVQIMHLQLTDFHL
jgi:hypothetical protein